MLMIRIRLFIILSFVFAAANAQQTVQQLRETAISFQRQSDYSNTMMVLAKALELEPTNLTLLKDVAFTYYLAGDYKRAAERILPLTDREDADVQVFQIAGNIFKATEEYKQCDKVYKKGLKKFDASGPLFAEYGDLLWTQQKPAEAIAQWETGISVDPSYSVNYYHAAKFYFAAADKARSLVYGEVFVNLESYSVRTAEIKILLLESYKRVFMPGDSKQHFIKPTTPFEQKFLEVMNKQSSLSLRGITPETLLVIRSRFLLDWFNDSAGKYPFKLFEHLQYLMREGMFEAYNQWLFGPATDASAYQHWTRAHEEEYLMFSNYQRNKLFRMPASQHYF
jgi:Tfp pilus assembly protein PilF